MRRSLVNLGLDGTVVKGFWTVCARREEREHTARPIGGYLALSGIYRQWVCTQVLGSVPTVIW